MQNKRGQGLEVSTLILIVLGVIILVLLVLGFSMGWGNLWEKVNIFQGGSSIESVIQGCKVAVSSASTYTYCSDFKKITVNGKIEYVNCEDTRVNSGLASKLSCSDSAGAIATECNSLYDSAPMSGNKKDCSALASVNGNPCATLNNDMITKCTSTIGKCQDYVISGTTKANLCDSSVVPSGGAIAKTACTPGINIIIGVVFTPALNVNQTCCKVACSPITA